MGTSRFPLQLVIFVLGIARLSAATGGFISTLTNEQQATAGLIRLSADEQTELNALVARDVSLARQGNVRAFAGTFLSRRHGDEAWLAGLDRLTAEFDFRDRCMDDKHAFGDIRATVFRGTGDCFRPR